MVKQRYVSLERNHNETAFVVISAYPTQVSIQYINRTVINRDHLSAVAPPNENNNHIEEKSVGIYSKGDGNPSKGKNCFSSAYL